MGIKKLLLVMLLAVVLASQGCSCYSWTDFWGEDRQAKCADHWHWNGKRAMAEPKVETQAYLPCDAPRLEETSRDYTPGITGHEISLSKLAPKEVALNEPFDYRLKITNVTDQELLNVVVTDVKPAHMKFISSVPEMESVEGQIQWQLGAIEPGASKTISINAVATEMGTITSCAEVTYDTPTCAQIEIVDPQLILTKFVPEESLVCDRIPVRYVITNKGSGHACSIQIEDSLAEGLLTSDGSSKVMFEIDTLGPGESREFETMVDASGPGRYFSSANAIAQRGGRASSEMVGTLVSQPVLAINESCPSEQYIGKMLTYDITVTNRGDAAAKDTIVEATVPDGVRFNNASDGGVYTHSSPGMVTWDLGEIQPNSSKTISMSFTSDTSGLINTEASAKAYCAESVSDTCRTELSGIPGVLLEVVDVEDPIEVGQSETYVITVTNQGSAADTNVQISCMLESNMEYVSSTGPTEAEVIGQSVSFAPLASLAPKAQAKWQVTVRAIGTGDTRFKTIMNTDQLDRSVEETEATRFYE